MKRIALIAVILFGCSTSSKPPHFYSLIENTGGTLVKKANQRVVIIEPVKLARQLDGVRIVYQVSATETAFLNHHLWAQNLGQQITQFMVNQLRVDMPGFWPTTIGMATNNDSRRIRIFFESFNGSYNGVAVIKGEWQLLNNQRRLYDQSFSYSVPMQHSGYDELIKALSKALILLCQNISAQSHLM